MLKITGKFLGILLICSNALANTGNFFSIVESGVAADLELTLCLDATAHLSCQKYYPKHQSLSISTTVPNHSYPKAGIKVHTPGYSIASSGCTPASNGFCVFSSSNSSPAALTVTSQQAVTVPLNNCEGDMFCISVGGAIFNNQTLPIRYDTGAATFSIPESCLAAGQYTVIASNVQDQFGDPSNLVKGSVSLMNGSNVAMTLDDFVFFARTGESCDIGGGSYGNFGAGMNYVINNLYMTCVASYVNFVTAYNKPSSAYGFTLQNGQNLLIGPITTDGPFYQQAGDPGIVCNNGILAGIPSYSSYSLDQGWPGPLVDNFAITIGGISVPVTQSNTSGTQPTTKLAQIDSGGGLMIIADDNQGTIINALDSVLNTTCYQSWLEGCKCVNAGTTVAVSSSVYGVSYSYTATNADSGTNLRSAVAVCPPWVGGSPNPYVSPNSANLGYQLFIHGTVIFNYQSGQIEFTGFT